MSIQNTTVLLVEDHRNLAEAVGILAGVAAPAESTAPARLPPSELLRSIHRGTSLRKVNATTAVAAIAPPLPTPLSKHAGITAPPLPPPKHHDTPMDETVMVLVKAILQHIPPQALYRILEVAME